MLELEHGKNYKTYFYDSNVKCFFTKKLYWKTVQGYYLVSNNDGSKRDSFLSNHEDMVDSALNIVNNITVENSTVEPCDIKVEFFKYAICCPCCHKVHKIEDFLTIKEDYKEKVKEIEERCGVDWYCLFDYEASIDKEKYFEGKYVENHKKMFTLYSCCKKYHMNEKYYLPTLTCPECGVDIREYEFEQLDIFNKISNAKPRAFTIFKDENKIALSVLFRTYYINPEAFKIAIEDFRVRLTFNTITGNTYFIGPKKLNGKKMSGWYYYYLLNITYRYTYGMPKIVDKILSSGSVKKKLLFALMEKNGHTIDRFSELPKINQEPISYEYENGELVPVYETLELEDAINYDAIPISFLTLYNRVPNLSCKGILQVLIKDGYSSNYYLKDVFKNIKRDTSSHEMVETFCKNAKMKASKKVKKLISENVANVKDMMIVRYFGFKDVNIIYKYIESPSSMKYYLTNYYSYSTQEKKKIKIFIKDMIKHKGESKTFNTIFNGECGREYLVDSAKMYVAFKENDMVINEYFQDNIKKIHDRLSKDYPKIKYANVVIPYKESAKRYNTEINGFKFTLAADTNELVKIGQDLKICVGGYRDQAINSRTIIISMKNSKDDYVGCLELSSDYRRLVQAKAVCNNLLQEHKAEALRAFVKTFDINVEDCYDYEHILRDDIQYDEKSYNLKNYDYHNLELDEEGNVVTRNY